MSTNENTVWLESAQETFEDAVDTENWALARAVIGDLKENNFTNEAIVLERELVTRQNEI